ncbi:MAG: hypothetical protein KF833_13410 [Verrucomicrobiae bacterium]|nr:hypothetical protein [Verrucomicrobiae bacterium]
MLAVLVIFNACSTPTAPAPAGRSPAAGIVHPASSGPAAIDVGSLGADVPEPLDPVWIQALAEAAGAGDREAWRELVTLGLDHRDVPAAIEQLTLAVGDAALVWVRELLSATARETRDVSGLLRQAAEGVGCLPRPGDWLALIREVVSRECCDRHAFLAAALSGMARGIELARHSAPIDPEAVWRLDDLAQHPDPGLAHAARMVQPHFQPGGDGL